MLSSRSKYAFQTLNILHSNFHHLSLYSTSTSTSAVNEVFTKYLVNSLGFTQQQALCTSAKLPPRKKKVIVSKVCAKADNVVHFLKQLGFNDTHLTKAVSLCPRVLCAKVDKTLKPKVMLFQGLGFSQVDLVRVISTNPLILFRRFNPIFPGLRVVMGSDDNLIKLFMRSIPFTSSTTLDNIVSNVALLKNDYGVDIQVIRNNILQNPGAFMRSTEFFRNVVVRVEKDLGIARNSGMFLYGISLLCALTEKSLECKRQVFKSFGWTEYYISDLMRRNPTVFWRSEENIRKRLGFLTDMLGYDPEFLVSHYHLFTYSLEKRMVPRYRVLQVLKEKGLLDYNFYSAAIKSETRFLKLFIEPFKEALPGLLEVYQNNKDGPDVVFLSG